MTFQINHFGQCLLFKHSKTKVMEKTNQPIELIIQTHPSTIQSKSMNGDLSQKLKSMGIEVEIISTEETKSSGKAKGLNGHETEKRNVLVRTKAKDTEINPWDMAHLSADAAGKSAKYIEPNILNEFVVDRKVDSPAEKLRKLLAAAEHLMITILTGIRTQILSGTWATTIHS